MTKKTKLTKKEKKKDCSGKAKVSRVKVKNLLAKGMSQTQVAKELGCARNTVCTIIKEQKLVTTKAVTLGEDVSKRLLDTNINTLDQLNRVNASLLDEMDKIKEELNYSDKGERKELRDVDIKYKAEHRKQMKLLLEIYSTTHQIEQVHKFQKIVMDVIRELEPTAAREIIKRLRAEQFVNKDLLI